MICCKSECVKHMLRNQCFVNIRSRYCKTYYKNNICMSIHLYKSFLQEEDKYIFTLADLSVSKYSSICICIIYIYISYCTISIYTPSNILEISSPVVLLALPVRPESLAVVLQWSRPAAGHPGRCSPLGACAWCPRWVRHGAGFIPVPMHVYIHWYMMIYWLIHADCSEDLQWLNRLSTVVVWCTG